MILLTGATGFLGRELLTRLLAEGEPVAALVRPSRGVLPEARILELLAGAQFYLQSGQLQIIAGDVTLPDFGLGTEAFRLLAKKIHTIFHCAASTSLGQNLEEARKINVGGTEQVLKLANLSGPSLDCLFHVSTAYVAGDVEKVVRPDELNLSNSFRNGYEQSKAESEALIRGSGLPFCVFRPSVIVGNSITGETTSFSMLYIPARLLVRGILSGLPASHTAPFDVVPVNYVADAIISLAKHDRSANAYHLSAGIGRESSPWEIVEFLIRTFNMYRERGLKALHMPDRLSAEMLAIVHHSICVARTGVKSIEKLFSHRMGVLAQVVPFFPYMIQNPRFDESVTTRDLNGEPPPLFSNYAERLFKYCLDTDWGRLRPEGVVGI